MVAVNAAVTRDGGPSGSATDLAEFVVEVQAPRDRPGAGWLRHRTPCRPRRSNRSVIAVAAGEGSE